MGLRCSILGHTFDETEVRRDRQERGESEVVTVVAQVERCSRCGAERVVSENKEVVSVVDADEVGLDEPGSVENVGNAGSAGGGTEPSEPPAPDTGQEPAPDAGQEPAPDTEETGHAEGDDGTDAASSTDEGADTETEPEPASNPAEEDVEFITETEGSLGGGDDVTEDVPPDAGGGIGGMAARSGAFDGSDDSSGADETGKPSEDAEILDAPERDRAPGQWPDEPGGDEPWEPGTVGGEEETEPEPAVEPVAEPSFTVPEGSFRCPNCGHEVSADSSFRAGDACPECQTGYLEAPEE